MSDDDKPTTTPEPASMGRCNDPRHMVLGPSPHSEVGRRRLAEESQKQVAELVSAVQVISETASERCPECGGCLACDQAEHAPGCSLDGAPRYSLVVPRLSRRAGVTITATIYPAGAWKPDDDHIRYSDGGSNVWSDEKNDAAVAVALVALLRGERAVVVGEPASDAAKGADEAPLHTEICPECGDEMDWDDTPVEPCNDCKERAKVANEIGCIGFELRIVDNGRLAQQQFRSLPDGEWKNVVGLTEQLLLTAAAERRASEAEARAAREATALSILAASLSKKDRLYTAEQWAAWARGQAVGKEPTT